MHLHLFRRGASDGSQTPFRWTRTNMPDVRHMLQPDNARACVVLQLLNAGCRMQAWGLLGLWPVRSTSLCHLRASGHCTPAAESFVAPQGGVLWQLLHGVAKTSLLGKAKRPPAHPCDVSIAIGPQVLPPPPPPRPASPARVHGVSPAAPPVDLGSHRFRVPQLHVDH